MGTQNYKKLLPVIVAVGIIALYFSNYYSDTEENNMSEIEGIAFLENNKSKEGVQTTDSGLQYKVLTPGTGTEHPGATSKVKVHYHGTFIDGNVFDSSVERGQPIEFGLNQVIRGWTEGVQLMVVGEKTRFFIPSDLAYGPNGMGPIPGGSTLIFDVELLDFSQ